MFNKLPRSKVFRDPLYGYINVDYEIISELIDAREVQRLRRVRQLSGVSMVFQTAEHSRFTHALGAYEVANLILDSVDGAKDNFTEYEKIVFLSAALLHDIGHGPYSHAFEAVLEVSHEDISAAIITSKTSDIYKILSSYDLNLPSDVAGIITHTGKYPHIESLVSSQIDVDRMDYLSRDAYFTGATYGTIDRCRLLRSMIIKNRQICFRPSGVNSIESYLMSRYHMYWQVYYHSKARAYELLLQSIYVRIKDLTKNNIKVDANVDAFLNVIKNNFDIESYIALDDAYVNGFIKQMVNSDDLILRKLSNAFQDRKLFKVIDLNFPDDEKEVKKIKEEYKDQKYFYYEETVSQSAYLHTDQYASDDINDIKILLPSGSVISLENYSPIIKNLIDTSMRRSKRIFYFEG